MTPSPSDKVNALLVCPEFPYSFWSFEETNALNGYATLTTPLGLVTVAALLPQHWDMRVRDLNARPLTEEDWQFADIVILTGMIVQHEGMMAVIAEARSRGIKIVVGGPYATSVPEVMLDAGCDYLVKGEGERAIPLFLEGLANGDASGIYDEGDEKPGMHESPLPRFDLLTFSDYETVAIQTSRGCPFNCEFCDIINLFGRKPRLKSVEQVMTEFQTLYRLGWRGTVFICDDNFIGNRDFAKELLEAYIPWSRVHGSPFDFICQASINLGKDDELIDLMTEANFCQVFVGIESPEEAVLAKANKHQNIKNPPGQSVRRMTEQGLSIIGSFVIGFDGETQGTGRRICRFVEENDIPIAMPNTLVALPNTQLWTRLTEEERLLDKGDDSMGMNFEPSRPKDEIYDEYVDMWNYLYDPPRMLARTYRHILRTRPTRNASGTPRPSFDTSGVQPVNTPPETMIHQTSRARQFISLLTLIWRRGILPSYRMQFWRQLIDIYRHNPSRVIRYLNLIGQGENMFKHRQRVLDKRSFVTTQM